MLYLFQLNSINKLVFLRHACAMRLVLTTLLCLIGFGLSLKWNSEWYITQSFTRKHKKSPTSGNPRAKRNGKAIHSTLRRQQHPISIQANKVARDQTTEPVWYRRCNKKVNSWTFPKMHWPLVITGASVDTWLTKFFVQKSTWSKSNGDCCKRFQVSLIATGNI